MLKSRVTTQPERRLQASRDGERRFVRSAPILGSLHKPMISGKPRNMSSWVRYFISRTLDLSSTTSVCSRSSTVLAFVLSSSRTIDETSLEMDAKSLLMLALACFGKTVVRQMNELGLVIDLSHTGERTTLEAIELSDYPCIFSHSNVNTIRPNDRNLSDDQIRAAASNGGVVGIAGFPSFVSSSERPKIDEFVAHIEYISELVGADHVGLGIDYASNPTGEEFDDLIEIGKWLPANYQRPPWHYPLGMEDVTLLPNLTEQLLQRGFSTEDIMKILGGNFLRVFQAVWG